MLKIDVVVYFFNVICQFLLICFVVCAVRYADSVGLDHK